MNDIADAKARERLYGTKSDDYFSGARHDMIALLSTGPTSHILEIGCGDGATGAAARRAGKVGHYCGIELVPAVAALAGKHLDEIVTGNVEQIDLSPLHRRFDALIMSEVLEHLVDPWESLARLLACLRPGGELIASSPNVAHRGVINGLISGRFDYAEAGVMDRTHLRWFTPSSYRALFEGAGCLDVRIMPVRKPGRLPRLFNRLTGDRYAHLSMTQIMAQARKPG